MNTLQIVCIIIAVSAVIMGIVSSLIVSDFSYMIYGFGIAFIAAILAMYFDFSHKISNLEKTSYEKIVSEELTENIYKKSTKDTDTLSINRFIEPNDEKTIVICDSQGSPIAVVKLNDLITV